MLAGIILAAGCGGVEEELQDPTQGGSSTWVNKKPVLLIASPGALAVGDTLTIMGQDFVDKTHGTALVSFKGTYYPTSGSPSAVDYSAKATVVSSGKLTWDLWPNIVFDQTGDHLGRFVGHLVVLNRGTDGSITYSEALPLGINISPSIIARVVRPYSSGCTTIVSDTLEKQAMTFHVEAVGLRQGTKDAPLTFYWTFLAEQWKVAFNYGTMDPSAVVPKKGAMVIEDEVTSGSSSSLQDAGPRSYLLRVGSDLLGSTRLKELKTGEIAEGGNNMPVSVNIAAVDASGKSVKLALRLKIHAKAELEYSGETKIAERMPPVRVTDCIPGQDIGREATYNETSSESRARSLGFSWNVSVGGNISPIPSNPFALGINFSAGFGVNISEQVSSDKAKSLSISGHILPGDYGSFYRQTTKIYRYAKILVNTVCGQSYQLGTAILTDWMYTPELATSATCPPPSSLPPAGKFLD